ncbi:dUTP diphosphatase [Candidatus Pacearchaeota archaeon]|nr:dUTP diphosphatase [Candidatus Pacearchaeota archaeon]
MEEGRGIGETGMMLFPKEHIFDYLPGQERVKAWMNHVIAEAIECKEELGFTHNDQLKHWKSGIDWDKVLEECMDQLHFWLAAVMDVAENTQGLDKKQLAAEIVDLIYVRYKEKLEENHARQDRGY